jgi:hypothetical protein
VPENRYFNCVTQPRDPIPWDPREPPVPGSWPNAGYFGKAFVAMEETLRRDGLTFYLTFDVERLPSYGRDVVAVIVDNELARIPPYAPRVRAVFNNLATRPQLGCSPLLEPSLMNTAMAAVFARNAAWWLPGGARYAAARLRDGRVAVHEVPVGTFNQLDLPLKPFTERTTTVVFAGSVVHEGAARIQKALSPKGISRAAMLRAVERLVARHPEVVADVGVTSDFLDSVYAEEEIYSRRMMEAKISLVPRGTVPITARFLESLRYGSLIITDHLSPSWFYAQAPVIRIRDWSALERTVMGLLEDEPRMLALHEQALDWWRRACSEEAVGRAMAATLNAQPD